MSRRQEQPKLNTTSCILDAQVRRSLLAHEALLEIEIGYPSVRFTLTGRFTCHTGPIGPSKTTSVNRSFLKLIYQF